MDFNTFANCLTLPTTINHNPVPTSLLACLQQLKDLRGKQGRRYRVSLVMTLLILAKLAGQSEITAIAQWVRLRADWLCSTLNLPSGRLPCVNTYLHVCRNIDPYELNQILTDFFSALSHPAVPSPVPPSQPPTRSLRHLAIDGKTLRGTLKSRNTGGKVHLLELYDVQKGLVLTQTQVNDKTNEISLAHKLIEKRDLRGCVVTGDALHTQKKWGSLVGKAGGHWLMIAKANQANLLEEIRFLFEGEKEEEGEGEEEKPIKEWPWWLEKRQARSVDKGHGRIEFREISVSNELKQYLGDTWSGVEQVFRLERKIICKGVTRKEVVYGLTSLSEKMASAAYLLSLVRQHWKIENRLHWRKDVTLKEDKCLVGDSHIQQVLATLNNTVLGLFDFLVVKNVPRQMQIFLAKPNLALDLLIGAIY